MPHRFHSCVLLLPALLLDSSLFQSLRHRFLFQHRVILLLQLVLHRVPRVRVAWGTETKLWDTKRPTCTPRRDDHLPRSFFFRTTVTRLTAAFDHVQF